MSKPLIKSRLLIGSKHLGDIFYNTDKNRDGYLKISFKNKIADLRKGTDITTTLPVSMPEQVPVKLELSYKFNGDVFSIKKTKVGEKPSYEFHKVEIPPQTCLFFLKIKDWTLLDDNDDATKSSLVIDAPSERSVAVVFSFLNVNGQPLSPPEYSDMLMGVIDLPEKNLSKFCIGIASDPGNTEKEAIIVAFPYTPREN